MEDRDMVSFCQECKSIQGEDIAARDPFLQVGKSGVCKFCGGVTVATTFDHAKQIKNKH